MDTSQISFLTKTPARRFDASAFALALSARLVFTAIFLAKGLDVVYARDLYYNLAVSWLGWAPAFAFDATHPPLYTAFLAAVMKLSGSSNQLPILLLQCLIGSAVSPLTRRLGSGLVSEKAARISALWVALDPGLIFFTPQLGTETLFITMTMIFFLGLFREITKPLSVKTIALGLWGGLCVLCRSVLGGYPAFLFLALWKTRGLVRAFSFCAILGIGWLTPSILWSVRNYHVYGRVVPFGAQMGYTLYEGFTLDREEVRRRPFTMGEEIVRLKLDDPIDRGNYFAHKTTEFVKANPGEALKIVLGKAVLFWRPFPYDPHTWWQRGILGIYFSVLFALALWGVKSVYHDPAWAPVWALFAYLTVLHSVFFTSLRYRVPLEPFLCLLAASGALALLERRRARA